MNVFHVRDVVIVVIGRAHPVKQSLEDTYPTDEVHGSQAQWYIAHSDGTTIWFTITLTV